jgi:hypothetical protein
MGPIPHHMHQSAKQAKLVGQEGKPESLLFPAAAQQRRQQLPLHVHGPRAGHDEGAGRRSASRNWNKGDNGILDLSKAYRLKPGTGWLIDPCVLHAPGSLCTYEPQWGSDVFGMYQNLVEGREVPWSLLVKDMPKSKHQDLDFIVDQLDWDKNVDPELQGQPLPRARFRSTARASEGYVDRWIVYGKVDGQQLFTAKELTVEPGAKCTIKDGGAYGLITVQGKGHDQQSRARLPEADSFPRTDPRRGVLHRGRARRPAWCSRTPARSSRSWCCATSAPRCIQMRRTSAITKSCADNPFVTGRAGHGGSS